ncbi:Anthoamide neuropeptides type 1 [Gryllus bimaculatus]|nr:Anthoamide neuropeptides type 1 [Gryllus bimaculatus]
MRPCTRGPAPRPSARAAPDGQRYAGHPPSPASPRLAAPTGSVEWLLGHLGENLEDDLGGHLEGDDGGHLEGVYGGHLEGVYGGHLEGVYGGHLEGDYGGHLEGDYGGHVDGDYGGHVEGDYGGHLEGDYGGHLEGDYGRYLEGDYRRHVEGYFYGTSRGHLERHLGTFWENIATYYEHLRKHRGEHTLDFHSAELGDVCAAKC